MRSMQWKDVGSSCFENIEIQWISTGYHMPATEKGPAEHSDEREITGIILDRKQLPADVVKAMAPHLLPLIEQEDLPELPPKPEREGE